MSRSYDVVVVGSGAMGSAVVYQLAKAGARCSGSIASRRRMPMARRMGTPGSHGSRSVRARRTSRSPSAHTSCGARSKPLTGEELLTVTGGVVISVPGGRGQHGAEDFLATTIATAQAHGVAHEVLDSAALAERLPPFALAGDERGMFEPSAGFVRPERAVAAQLRLAREHGAELRTGERVISAGDRRSSPTPGTYTAETIVLAAGPWLTELRPELAAAFTVSRQVLHWFALAPGTYEAHRDLPVFIWITGDGPEEFVYGFPAIDGPDGGLKVASEQFPATTTPAACRREVTAAESRQMHARFLARRFPVCGPEPSTRPPVSTRAPPTAASRSALTPATGICWSSRRAPATASSTPRPSAKRSRNSPQRSQRDRSAAVRARPVPLNPGPDRALVGASATRGDGVEPRPA